MKKKYKTQKELEKEMAKKRYELELLEIDLEYFEKEPEKKIGFKT